MGLVARRAKLSMRVFLKAIFQGWDTELAGQPLWSNHYDQPLWSTIVINHRDQPSWSTVVINRCDQPLWSTVVINRCDQPSWSTIVINHRDRPSWSTIVINHRDQPSWSTIVKNMPQEVTGRRTAKTIVMRRSTIGVQWHFLANPWLGSFVNWGFAQTPSGFTIIVLFVDIPRPWDFAHRVSRQAGFFSKKASCWVGYTW